jgi:hypothetical protein
VEVRVSGAVGVAVDDTVESAVDDTVESAVGETVLSTHETVEVGVGVLGAGVRLGVAVNVVVAVIVQPVLELAGKGLVALAQDEPVYHVGQFVKPYQQALDLA